MSFPFFLPFKPIRCRAPCAAPPCQRADFLSLPGQRMSACTCKGEDHAGPAVNYGRGVPEIDVLEAQTDLSIPQGQVSQSCQVAPFDANYNYVNTSTGAIQYDTTKTKWNSYKGGQYQEAVSSLTYISTNDYQLTSG